MALFELQPSVALQEFIRVYRIVHFVFDSKATLPFKAYPPRAEHCLSFYPKDTETVSYTKSATKISNLKSVLMGQQSEITNRFVGNDFLVFQIVFRPGALFRITGIPSYELTNSYIDAETIFPKEIKNINVLKKGVIIWLVMIFVISFIPSKEIVKKMYLIDNPTSKMTLEVLETVKE